MSFRNVPRYHYSSSESESDDDLDYYSSSDEEESKFHVEEFRSVSQALDRAEEIIEYLHERGLIPKHPTAVFDLDETVLKYIGPNEDCDFPRKYPGMGNFIDWLRRKGVDMCFITARREKGRRETMRTIQKLNIWKHGDQLIMKPNDAPSNSSSIVKDEQRRQLVKEGHSIIINVGDQISDIIPKPKWRDFLHGALKLSDEYSLRKEIRNACKKHKNVTDILEEAMAKLTKTLLFRQLEKDVLISIKMRNQEFFTR